MERKLKWVVRTNMGKLTLQVIFNNSWYGIMLGNISFIFDWTTALNMFPLASSLIRQLKI